MEMILAFIVSLQSACVWQVICFS